MLLGETLNFLFGIEALIIASVLPRQGANKSLYKNFVRLFLSLGTSSMLWCVYHISSISNPILQRLLWDSCLISLGFTAITLWFISIKLSFANALRKQQARRIVKAGYFMFIIFICIVVIFMDIIII